MCNSDLDQPKQSLEQPEYVQSIKSKWAALPTSMSVIEYSGSGDPFFGGNADDRALGINGEVLVPPYSSDLVAEFRTIEDAHQAAKKIKNRRPGSILGVCPYWEKEPAKPEAILEKCPRLLLALRKSCLLTATEAVACLKGIEAEAVRHLGGRDKAIQIAFQSRHAFS
jgi:hypothetical protein